jgi:hypothetical protein
VPYAIGVLSLAGGTESNSIGKKVEKIAQGTGIGLVGSVPAFRTNPFSLHAFLSSPVPLKNGHGKWILCPSVEEGVWTSSLKTPECNRQSSTNGN